MKKTLLRIIILMLTFSICMTVVACGKDKDSSNDTSDDTSDTETQLVESQPNEEDSKPTEEESTGDDKPAPSDPKAHLRVDTKWHFGCVGSYMNAQSPNAVADETEFYSYTDVFTVAEAGTTVTFAIKAEHTDGVVENASSSVYVFSQWKQENGAWVLMQNGANYVGGDMTSSIVAYSTKDTIIYSYTTSYDNESLRVCYRSGQTKSFTPESFPKIYAEDRDYPGTELPDFYDVYYSNLAGVTLSAVGDSYFDGVATNIGQENIWVNLLAEKYKMNYKVDGVGGATVADARDNRVPVCERYKNVLADANIVLLEGGRNDYNISGVGADHITLPDSVKQDAANKGVDIQVPLGDINSTDTKTFMGAWNVIIAGVKEKCPNAMIVLISPWNFPDIASKSITRMQYINAMKQLALKHGVYFIDASDTSLTGVDMQNADFRAEYSTGKNDVSHLNAKGMKLVMPKFEKIISEYYEHFLSKDTAGLNKLLTPEDVEAERDMFVWVWNDKKQSEE